MMRSCEGGTWLKIRGPATEAMSIIHLFIPFNKKILVFHKNQFIYLFFISNINLKYASAGLKKTYRDGSSHKGGHPLALKEEG